METILDHNRERLRRQRSRSIAIGLGLGAMVVLFYIATIVRLGPNALNKDGFGASRGKPATMSTTHGSAKVVPTSECKQPGGCQ